MDLKPGNRLKSAVCETEIIVVKAPEGGAQVTCGGTEMAAPEDIAEPSGQVSGDASEGTLLGKRYINEDESLEVLCTKAGEGSLGSNGTPLQEKESKPLPASD